MAGNESNKTLNLCKLSRRERCERYFTSRYANALLLSVNMSKEVPVSTEKWNRNEIVGGLLGRVAVTNFAVAQALFLEETYNLMLIAATE